MIVAIDFDGTFSLNPPAWTEVINTLKMSGAEVICITSRFPNVPISGIPISVYYSCGQPKWEFANERGIAVDVWIDDMPSCIGGPPIEPGQAKIRRDLMRQVIDANFKVGPYDGS